MPVGVLLKNQGRILLTNILHLKKDQIKKAHDLQRASWREFDSIRTALRH